MIMAYYTIEDIKIAALDAMMEHSTFSITGMPFLAAMLEKLTNTETVETAPVAVTELEITEPEAAAEPEPVQAEEPKKAFMGPGAELKRKTVAAIARHREQGMSVPNLVQATGGKLSDEDIFAMMGCKKVPFNKWKIMAAALGVEETS